jgi:hypothetical protein
MSEIQRLAIFVLLFAIGSTMPSWAFVCQAGPPAADELEARGGPVVIPQLGVPTFEPNGLAISRDGTSFVVPSHRPSVWDARTGGLLRFLGDGSVLSDREMRLASFLPHSNRVLAFYEPDRLAMIDLENGRLKDIGRTGNSHARFLLALPGERAVIGTLDSATVWDVSGRRLLEVLGREERSASYTLYAADPDLKLLAMLDAPARADLYDLRDRPFRILKSLNAEKNPRIDCKATATSLGANRSLAIGYVDGTLRLYRDSGVEVGFDEVKVSELEIRGLAFSPSGSSLAALDKAGTLAVFGIGHHPERRFIQGLLNLTWGQKLALAFKAQGLKPDLQADVCALWFVSDNRLNVLLGGSLVQVDVAAQRVLLVKRLVSPAGAIISLDAVDATFTGMNFFGVNWIWSLNSKGPTRVEWNWLKYEDKSFTYNWPVGLSPGGIFVAEPDGGIRVLSPDGLEASKLIDMRSELGEGEIVNSLHPVARAAILLVGVASRLYSIDLTGRSRPRAESVFRLPDNLWVVRIASSEDGAVIALQDDMHGLHLLMKNSGRYREIRSWRGRGKIDAGVAIATDGKLIAADRAVYLLDPSARAGIVGVSEGVLGDGPRCFSRDGKFIVQATEAGASLSAVRVEGDVVHIAPVDDWPLKGRAFLDLRFVGEDCIASLNPGLQISLYRWRSGEHLADLFGFEDDWLVVGPDGRFDASNLETILVARWTLPDDPMRSLAPEIFLRDYYEPRLLTRIVEGGPFTPIRPLESLNRVQPDVEIVEVRRGDATDKVRVSVRVERRAETIGRGATSIVKKTDGYDLRLFRDGQLVGRWPEPADDSKPEPDPTKPEQLVAWQDENRVTLAGGRATRTFTVQLPREPGRKVEFTAYAFNEDRVKSATSPSVTFEVPQGVPAAQPRAYIVVFGVAGFSDPAWDLRYSADDARLAAAELGCALQAAKHYEVRRIVLATDRGAAGAAPKPGEAAASAANLHAILARLAGGPKDPAALGAIPGYAALEPASPDDLVLLFASSHGYTDRKGAYYLFPSDIGPPRQRGRELDEERDTALLAACVSSGELSAWLRGVDAGLFALVVDCCHAAATVEQPGFKPGPMGSRGLGQLAYDKAMRVLAASQADDVALEALVKGEGHGLLTYALVREGLAGGKAAIEGTGLTLGGLLRYAEGRVPALYAEVLRAAGGRKGATPGAVRVLVARGDKMEPLGDAAAPQGSSLRKDAFQQPSLFDYARRRDAKLVGQGKPR